MTTLNPISHSAVQEETLCAHCNLPVPAGLIEPDTATQFCCPGCRTVYTLIHSCRLDRYYQYRAADASPSQPAATTHKAYREFDNPIFLNLHAPASPDGRRTTDFYLEGIHCAACVWLVEKLPHILPGVLEARLDLAKSLVHITWTDTSTSLSQIARTLDSLGYPPHPARAASARLVRTLDARRQLIRIGVAGACAGNNMLLGIALYAGLFATMDPVYIALFRYLSMIIGLVSVLWPGSVFFRGAIAAIRTRTPHLDLPIALGLAAGAFVGTLNTLLNRGEIYFDSLSVLVFLLLVGRFLQYRQTSASDDAVELLFSLTPMSARRRTTAGATEEVPISALQPNDLVDVLPGECIPADGLLAQGASSLDESLLTGEPLPRTLSPGDPIFAGTTNISSPITVRVRAIGESTRVGKLMRLVTECARQKAPIVLFADRIAGYFLLAVILIAIATLALWLSLGHTTAAVDHAVAILIVACPCALGLATPLAVSVAIGRAAQRAILIKGGATLERLATPGTLLLDKTGTLTFGRISLIHYTGDPSLQPLIAAIESHATHPIARALATAFPLDTTDLPIISNLTQSMHGGISAIIDQKQIIIGSPAFITSHGLTLPSPLADALQSNLAQGLTPVLVAVDNQVSALCALGDQIRPDVPAALNALRARGWSLAILSGDHPAVIAHIARQLDIPQSHAHGGLLPEDKLRIIRETLVQSARPVVMVGDGVNDAAALAAASVGIAVHGGAEASLAAANVYLRTPGLSPIVDLTHAAAATLRTIRRSLYASLSYNIFAVALAVAGLLNPLIAAILMPISSLTVLTLALAAPTFTPTSMPRAKITTAPQGVPS